MINIPHVLYCLTSNTRSCILTIGAADIVSGQKPCRTLDGVQGRAFYNKEEVIL